jgi:Protein kinase domain
MGCSASKEADVVGGTGDVKNSFPPPSVPPGGGISTRDNAAKSVPPAKAESALSSNGVVGGGGGTKQTHPSSSSKLMSSRPPPGPQSSSLPASATMTDKQKADALAAGLLMVQLNDVVPGSTEGGAGNNRGRFLSYASGASTPNTSSGNLSWSGEAGDSDKDSTDGRTPHSPRKGGSGTSLESSSGSRNPKMLKHSLSGSAIDLENLHREKSCTLTSKVVHIEVPFGKPIEEVYDGVHNGPVLGSGVSGLVRLVTHRATGISYAVKCLDLGLVGTKEGLEQLREEIFIMCQLDHPNIVRLEEVYESHSEIYLVQELCLGGELFDRLDEQPDYHYTEAQCARLVKQMLSAVRYLHSKGKNNRWKQRQRRNMRGWVGVGGFWFLCN